MARVTIIRATDVRFYQTFTLDTDEMTPEQHELLGREYGGTEYEPADLLDARLEAILDLRIIESEDHIEADNPCVNYMADYWED